MSSQGFFNRLHKKLAGISSALMLTGLLPVMVIGGLVSSSSSAHANLVVDAANATFSFTSKTNIVGNGTANNDVVRFNNAFLKRLILNKSENVKKQNADMSQSIKQKIKKIHCILN
jgi:hypothetical protein